MKDSVWKRISGKAPKGAKMLPAVALVSAVVWVGAIAVFFLFKGGGQPEKAEGHGHGGAMDASAHSGNGEDADASPGTEESDDDGGGEGPRTETADEKVHAGHDGSEAHEGHEGGESHDGKVAHDGNIGHGENDAAHAGSGEAHAAAEARDPHAESAEADAGSEGGMPTREEAAALRQVAELRVAAGDKAKAVTPMRRVLRAPGADADLLAMAADVFLSTGNYREAVEAGEKLLAQRPGDMRAKVQCVEARYRMGDIEKAMAEARETIK
jgi:hypothetical protein